MKNFIDFIVDVAKDGVVGDELHKIIESGDHKVVASWLQGKGYDVSEEDSKKLVENKDDIKSTKLGVYY